MVQQLPVGVWGLNLEGGVVCALLDKAQGEALTTFLGSREGCRTPCASLLPWDNATESMEPLTCRVLAWQEENIVVGSESFRSGFGFLLVTGLRLRGR